MRKQTCSDCSYWSGEDSGCDLWAECYSQCGRDESYADRPRCVEFVALAERFTSGDAVSARNADGAREYGVVAGTTVLHMECAAVVDWQNPTFVPESSVCGAVPFRSLDHA